MKSISISFLIILLFLTACNNTKLPKFLSYGETEVALQTIPTTIGDVSTLIFQNDTSNYLLTYYTNFFVLTDVKTDSVIKVLKFPYSCQHVKYISATDTANFLFYAEHCYFVYHNSHFEKYDISIFKDEYLPLPYVQPIYLARQRKVVAAVLSQDIRKRGKINGYTNEFINIYNLSDSTSKIVPLKYPTEYQGGRLGIPDVYLSQTGDKVVISLGYTKDIYILDLSSLQIQSIPCVDPESDLDVDFPKDSSKQKRLDAMFYNMKHQDSYGKAFLDTLNDIVYRMFYPGLPFKDGRNFMHTDNSGCRIIRKKLNAGSVSEYFLPNGVYFLPSEWGSHYEDSEFILTYKKIMPNVKNKKNWNYFIQSIHPYGF